jgi:YD repeat-containing protein
VDGAQAGSQTGLTENGYNATYKYFLGTMYRWESPNIWFYYGGLLDEVRVSASARSSDWILTEYRSQGSPATFLSVGAQQTSGGGGTVSITITSSPSGQSLAVDGVGCTAPCSFQWVPGATHTIAANNPTTIGWGQSYSYDGFGNLTDVTTTKGSTPELHTGYDPATNHGSCADANGNTSSGCGYTYDIENRIALAGGVYYGYAPGNKRVAGRWRNEG